MPRGRVRGTNGWSWKAWKWQYICFSEFESGWLVGKAKLFWISFQVCNVEHSHRFSFFLFCFFSPISSLLFFSNVQLDLPKSHRQKCSFCQFYTVTSRLLNYMDFKVAFISSDNVWVTVTSVVHLHFRSNLHVGANTMLLHCFLSRSTSP